jgi:ribosomal protein S27E
MAKAGTGFFITITKRITTMTDFLDMRCPNCGDERFIDIEATVRIRVCCDGTDADASGDGTHIFNADSLAFCGRCGFRGTVRKFERPDAETKAGAA